jgi:hypothetical protein
MENREAMRGVIDAPNRLPHQRTRAIDATDRIREQTGPQLAEMKPGYWEFYQAQLPPCDLVRYPGWLVCLRRSRCERGRDC